MATREIMGSSTMQEVLDAFPGVVQAYVGRRVWTMAIDGRI